MAFCNCGGSTNTGLPINFKPFKRVVQQYFVRMFADDGSANTILDTDVIDQAFIDAKIANADESKRWYPLGEFKTLTDERGDPITESFEDGSSEIATQGIRVFSGLLLNLPAKYKSKVEAFRCNSFGVFEIDICGSLRGSSNKAETILSPIEVNEKSLEARLIKATATISQKIQVSYEYSQLENDENLLMIPSELITGNTIKAEGLLDVIGSSSNTSTTGFTVTQTVEYSKFGEKIPSEGFVIGDYTLLDKDGVAIVITSVTEGLDGVYAFIIPTQSLTDVLTLDGLKSPSFELIQLKVTL